jgi:hypothetical protein
LTLPRRSDPNSHTVLQPRDRLFEDSCPFPQLPLDQRRVARVRRPGLPFLCMAWGGAGRAA